jgi:8-oxo-dGTP pyrophosphatase MutT (NUDIX family)
MNQIAGTGNNMAPDTPNFDRMDAQPTLRGEWRNGARWIFHLNRMDAEPELVTAVFCIALTPEGVVLTTTKRGVKEHLGGHVEPGESIEAALCREALEEGGITLQQFAQLGFREVFIDNEIINKSTGKPYPARACIPYYVAFSALPLQPVSGEEVATREVFSISEALEMDLSLFPEKREFELLLKECVKAAGMPVLTDLTRISCSQIQAALSRICSRQE